MFIVNGSFRFSPLVSQSPSFVSGHLHVLLNHTTQRRFASWFVIRGGISAIKNMQLQVAQMAFTHPVTLFLFQTCISTSVLLSTPPSSVIRPLGLLLILACAWLTVPTYLGRLERIPWTAFAAGHTILGVLQYVELVLLRQWSSQELAQTSSLRHQHSKTGDSKTGDSKTGDSKTGGAQGFSFTEKLHMGYFVGTSSRHVATSIESKGVPCFSPRDSKYIPSRRKLLLDRMAICVLSYVVLDFAALGLRWQHAQNASSRSLSQVPILTRLHDVSLPEVGTRIQDAVGYYVFCYSLIQCYTSTLACVALTLNIDAVRSWKPNFGPLQESYNLRRFWG